MLYDMTAVALGAVFGALLRWLLGLMLADTVSWFALGTLAANWFGGFLIGIAAGFSLEIVGMLQAQRWAAAAATASLHLFGSLLFTVLGIYLVQCFK